MRFFMTAIAAVLMTAPAVAQVQRVQPYQTQTVPYPGVPGQNTSPPAPRQQMIAPPPTPPRPSTGDAANRIQGSTRKPLPNVNGQ
ncbi:hypothetical protein [Roseixanthobacter glucoisosaccharinicivorans]|uniref:hypothetical protein n=1 Tax=Roseixanthobacter glucoisosaccharinicivorans TaxID=3119923 RepID=UPI00372AA488